MDFLCLSFDGEIFISFWVYFLVGEFSAWVITDNWIKIEKGRNETNKTDMLLRAIFCLSLGITQKKTTKFLSMSIIHAYLLTFQEVVK